MSNFSHSLSKDDIERFSRQLILKGIGTTGQEKIRDSAVLIVGAGGLGCPVVMYLAASGVGRLGIIDHDVVALNNLHRQIMHDENRIGLLKTESLKESINRINSAVVVEIYSFLLSEANALEIFPNYDIIVDCSDNVATRYLINDASILTNKPLVSGSALGWEGQLTVYHCGEKCPCYRCIFPIPPKPEFVTNCSDNGVLGPIVGVVGSLQALEILKLIVQGTSSFAGKLWLFDGYAGETRTISLRPRRSDCPVCGQSPTIKNLENYARFCGSGPTDKPLNLAILPDELRVTVNSYDSIRQNSTPILIDTRPENEYEICHLPEAINIPMHTLNKKNLLEIEKRIGISEEYDKTVYVICRRGNDSQLAVQLLNDSFKNLKFQDIIGGYEKWSELVDMSFPIY
uniref:Adenylyltransferase and sulfurtransferase MOCS3 homolog n=1 Tax=Acrobeloides nanus TaxID=290746 RepID=A0A914D4Y4_9BILA